MDLMSKYYSEEVKQFILSKVKMDWWKIPESLKKFWFEWYKSGGNGS
jgi:hypothetical protein